MSDKNINKMELSKKINQTVGFSKVISENIVKDIFYIIENALKTNDKIKITSFGTFFKKRKNSRIGRNPKTKEEVIINDRNVITFKASKKVLSVLNSNMND